MLTTLKHSFSRLSWKFSEKKSNARKLDVQVSMKKVRRFIKKFYDTNVEEIKIVYYPFHATISEEKKTVIYSGVQIERVLPFSEVLYRQTLAKRGFDYKRRQSKNIPRYNW